MKLFVGGLAQSVNDAYDQSSVNSPQKHQKKLFLLHIYQSLVGVSNNHDLTKTLLKTM